MKVYVVQVMVDEEYGCMEAEAVYSSQKAAQAWVDEHQLMLHPWYCEDEQGVPLYEVEEFDLL